MKSTVLEVRMNLSRLISWSKNVLLGSTGLPEAASNAGRCALSMQQAYGDRHVYGDNAREREGGVLSQAQSRQKTVFHNSPDSFLQIRSRHSGDACQGRFHIHPANREYPFGIGLRIARGQQRLFIASALALFDKPPSDPPDQRMKPKHSLHGHMDRRGQVIAAAHVTEFVSQDRSPLL